MTFDKNQLPEKQEKMIRDLLNKVESMSDDSFREMLNGMIKFHNYSFYNRCIIMISNGSQVAGFNQWKKQGRWVKKGASAIQILAPKMCYQIFTKGKFERTTQIKHKNFKGKKKAYPIGFFTVNVFDIKSTEGKDLPDPMTEKSNIGYTQVLKAAENLGYSVDKKPLEFSLGGYIEEGKQITINSNRQESGNVGTLIHELAHGELGHIESRGEHSRELCEQQAETVTYFVCQELGIERKSEFYLKSWKLSKDIMKDFKALHKVSQDLVRAIKPNSMRFISDD